MFVVAVVEECVTVGVSVDVAFAGVGVGMTFLEGGFRSSGGGFIYIYMIANVMTHLSKCI